ncbi:TrbI/VirB10 family protein [Sphingobium phenoxybenzoativorans]|uniref:TrbI/VirB10 family protein n=1 Tax=Sphingobium phenoxybenzoativorans TaxID=1592790 RepID=UPI000872DC94|nr:TrbI/VirB10 family protein [Sphingobium phenoxybenzoativorans]
MSARDILSEGEGATSKAAVPAEALVLRSSPERSVRLRRGAIIAGSAVIMVAVAIAGWMAFDKDHRYFDREKDRDELSQLPGAVRDLPSTYASPLLGPKLPGDLGRPILARQRHPVRIATSEPPPDHYRAMDADVAPTARDIARGAGLMVPLQGSPPNIEMVAATPTIEADPVSSPRLALASDTDPNAQQRKSDFLTGESRQNTVNSHAQAAAPSPYMLMAGSIISGSLITAIDSDLPGLVTAQVTERVFDSVTGMILLIPQGSRLVGSYDSVVAYGQKRAFVVWQRILFPDGSSLVLDKVPATDPSGRSGLADRVNEHAFALLRGAAVSSLLGVGANLGISGESDLLRAFRESTQQNISRAGDMLVSRSLQVQPSISIRPGASVRMVVHQDLILRPWSS